MATLWHAIQALTKPIPPPQTKKRRRAVTNDERRAIRAYSQSFDASARPTQALVAQWFERTHHHPITQGQVSEILDDRYKWLDSPEYR